MAAKPIAGQYDLFASDPTRLVEDRELRRLYDKLNQQYFGGKLPPAQIEWSTRMRIAGSCRPDKPEIRLSVSYHTYYPEEIESTLLHEMLHILFPKHDRNFRRAAENLGVSIHCREYPGIHSRSKYVYMCPHCRTVYYRQRRARNISCGACSGGKYDERYKLVLKKSTAKGRGRG